MNDEFDQEELNNQRLTAMNQDRNKIIDFPLTGYLRPEQALAVAQKTRWHQCLVIGLTEEGGYQIVNSEMPCERAVWLIEWAKKWALEGRF